MVTRKPISLAKGSNAADSIWPEEPLRFTEDHVDPFLVWGVKKGASDITFQTDRPVYCDIHGVIYPSTYRPLDAADMAAILNKIYGPDALARLASGRDLDISYEVKPDRYTRFRFRTNITAVLSRGRDSVQITMRSLPSEPPTMEDLNVEDKIVKAWSPRNGIVVVT